MDFLALLLAYSLLTLPSIVQIDKTNGPRNLHLVPNCTKAARSTYQSIYTTPQLKFYNLHEIHILNFSFCLIEFEYLNHTQYPTDPIII